MEKEKIITQEAVHAVSEEEVGLKAIIRRDPISGKHLVYLVQEAASEDIATLIGRQEQIMHATSDIIIDDDEEKKG